MTIDMDMWSTMITQQGPVTVMFLFLVWWTTQRLTAKLDCICANVQEIKEMAKELNK